MNRKLAFVIPKTDGKVDFNVAKVAINNEVSISYDENSQILTDFLHPLYLAHKMVSSNYENFNAIVIRAEKELQQQSKESLFLLDPYAQTMELMAELNLCVLNILTSQSLYLEKSAQLARHQFGSCSNEYIEFDTLRRQLHKESVSYRFCYDLRNYAQHYGLPINKLNIKFTANERPTLTITIVKSKLLEEGYDWKNHGLAALKGMEDKFDLVPHLKNYNDVANKLFLQLYGSCEDRLEQFHSVVANIKKKAQAPEGVRIFFVCNFNEVESDVSTEEIPYSLSKKLESYVLTF